MAKFPLGARFRPEHPIVEKLKGGPRTGPTINRGKGNNNAATPWKFIHPVEAKFGPIDIDLAAQATSSKALWYISPEQDSLTVEWAKLTQPGYAVDVLSKSQRTLNTLADEGRTTLGSSLHGVGPVLENMQNLNSAEEGLTQLSARYCWLKSAGTLHLQRAESGNANSRSLTTTSESNERETSRGTGPRNSGSDASDGGATPVRTADEAQKLHRTTSSPSPILTALEQSQQISSRPAQDVTRPKATGARTSGARIGLPSPVSSFTYNPLCFLNPPYFNITVWAKKCAVEVQLGARILLLVPASVGANWWWDWVVPYADVYSVGRMVFDDCYDKQGKLITTPYPKDLFLCHYDWSREAEKAGRRTGESYGDAHLGGRAEIIRWRWQNG